MTGGTIAICPIPIHRLLLLTRADLRGSWLLELWGKTSSTNAHCVVAKLRMINISRRSGPDEDVGNVGPEERRVRPLHHDTQNNSSPYGALFDLMACATPKKRGAIHDAKAGDSAPPRPRLPSSAALSSARRHAARRGGSRHDRKITPSARGATAISHTAVQRRPSSARRDARYRCVGRKRVASSDRRRCFGPDEIVNRQRGVGGIPPPHPFLEIHHPLLILPA
jgi:hypothetical protein